MAEPHSERPPLPDHELLFKLLLIGDSGVGKTSLLLRYAEDRYTESSQHNIGVDYKVRVVEIEGKKIALEIWDTAGQERFRTITASFYKGAHGVLLVYDIGDPESFTSMKEVWLREIVRYGDTEPKKILIGNKSDIPASERRVSSSEAAIMGDQQQMQTAETSAKTGSNVEDVFMKLAREIYDSGIINSAAGGADASGEVVHIRSATRKQGDSGSGGCCGGKKN